MFRPEGRQIPKKVRAYLQVRISAKAIALLDDLQKMMSAPDPSSVLERVITDAWERLRAEKEKPKEVDETE